MSPKLLIPLFALAVLLSACSSTIVTEEERELPTEQKEEMQDSAFTGERNADLSQSFVAFVGSKGDMASFEGKFNEFTADIEFESGEPVSVEATIQIKSMETDVERLTIHLLDPDFFESDTYGEATFVSSSVEATGDGEYSVTGTLTMKDISNEEVITMTITDSYLQATHTIDRTAYNVGLESYNEGANAIDAEVPLEIKVVFQ